MEELKRIKPNLIFNAQSARANPVVHIKPVLLPLTDLDKYKYSKGVGRTDLLNR